MKKDKVLLAALIGGISTLAGEIVTKILVMLGVGQYAVFELNSMLITNNKPSMLMGFLINFIVGGYGAVMLYLVFKWLGAGHLVLKSTMFSLILWFIFELAFTLMIEDKYIPLRSLADHYVHICGTASFGLTVGFLFKAYLFPVLSEEKEVNAR